MYLLYLDESGDPSASNDQEVFVLGGVAIFEGEIQRVGQRLDDLQSLFLPSVRAPVEFHANEIRRGKGKFSVLRADERHQLTTEVYALLSSERQPGLVSFATAVHYSAVAAYDQLRARAFEDVCERFNRFLVRMHKAGNTQKGLLVVDRSHSEPAYLRLVAQFREAGTRHGYLGNIVDIPYFTQSHNTRMVQLADFVAHAVYRYYEHGDRAYFEQILGTFDRRPERVSPDGLKHVAGSGATCRCEACRRRQ